MDNDDTPIGRILTRREILSLFGAAGAALVAAACSGGGDGGSRPSATATGAGEGSPSPASTRAATSPTSAATAAATSSTATQPASTALLSCVVSPALTEGPFFVDEKLDRADIRTDSKSGVASAGVPLVLNVGVFQASNTQCIPLHNAVVDVWQCDAAGVYSDVTDRSVDSRGKDFLRGFQRTNTTGQAKFTTIYPGWYPGRATHIHFKVRVSKDGKEYDFTSQWFFDEAVNDEVYRNPPYVKAGNRTLNASDGIFRTSGGQTLVPLSKAANGYEGTFNVGMKL